MRLSSMEPTDDAQSESSSFPVNSPNGSVSDCFSSFSSFGCYELRSGRSISFDDESSLFETDKTGSAVVPGTEAQQDAEDSFQSTIQGDDLLVLEINQLG